MVAIDAEPEEKLQDGEAGLGGLGGGDEVDEDAEDTDGEGAVAVGKGVGREGELRKDVHERHDGAERCGHSRRVGRG